MNNDTKKGFMFYHNWKNQIDLMNDIELRNFINNLIRFDKDEEVILNTKEEKLCWLGIEKALEINKNKWNIKSNNGKLGGAPIGNKNAVGKGAPKGNKNAVGKGAPKGNKNAVDDKVKNKQIETNKYKQIQTNTNNQKQTTLFENIENDIDITNKQPKTTETSVNSKELIVPVEDLKKEFFSKSSKEGPDILEDTGPKNEFDDNSTIYFPSSTDYGKINSLADKVIPTEKYDTGAEIIDITDMKIIETSMKPKEIIPTPVVKSNISTGEAPEFLTNGIEFNGEIHYPLSLKFIRSTKTLAEYNRNKFIADELIKTIQRQRSSEIKIYQKNKAVIVNSKFLTQHKEKISTLDYKAFIDYLNSIRQDLKPEQKKEIRQNAEVIKKCINNIEYYDIAIKEISNKMKT